MHGFEEERTLMRIHVEEQDKFEGKPVYECIVQCLRSRHLAGATAFRALEGFGPTGRMHESGTWSLKLDCPVVIECVDTDENIQSILPELDRMVSGGIITLERVRVIMYRKAAPPEERGPRVAGGGGA
jgi:hypothetical protein